MEKQKEDRKPPIICPQERLGHGAWEAAQLWSTLGRLVTSVSVGL